MVDPPSCGRLYLPITKARDVKEYLYLIQGRLVRPHKIKAYFVGKLVLIWYQILYNLEEVSFQEKFYLVFGRGKLKYPLKLGQKEILEDPKYGVNRKGG